MKSHFAANAGAAPSARRIHEWLKSQMADGSLAVGARLPSTRALALDLGVSRTTITAAYEQLAAEGYLETAQGARAPGRAWQLARSSAAARPALRLRRRIADPACLPMDGAWMRWRRPSPLAPGMKGLP